MSKIDKIYVKIRNDVFFEKYAFRDIDDEYWETKKRRDIFNEGEKYEIPWIEQDLLPAISSTIVGCIIYISREEAELKDWGIEYILTKENYPEYYI